jgi:hypothetical protein
LYSPKGHSAAVDVVVAVEFVDVVVVVGFRFPAVPPPQADNITIVTKQLAAKMFFINFMVMFQSCSVVKAMLPHQSIQKLVELSWVMVKDLLLTTSLFGTKRKNRADTPATTPIF